jgi:DNA-binding LytR/AlgR family response regulator
MKCIVIDDERIAREGLMEFIKEFDFLENIGSYSNAHLALEKLKTETVDLIFLDIQMPFMNGLEFAQIIRDNASLIIFTTAFSEYALKGYKVNAVDYLLKPIFFDDFKASVYKAKKMFDLMHQKENVSKPLYFKENGIIIKVLPAQITHIQSLQNYVELHFENRKKVILHQTLKGILDLLPEEKFLQIHKSYIVNLNHISHLDGTTLYIGEICLPIARSRREEILRTIRN